FSRDWSSDVCSSDLILQDYYFPNMAGKHAANKVRRAYSIVRIHKLLPARRSYFQKAKIRLSCLYCLKQASFYFRSQDQADIIREIGRASCREGGEET